MLILENYKESGWSIQSIADQYGYADNSNLKAVFGKKFGHTPNPTGSPKIND